MTDLDRLIALEEIKSLVARRIRAMDEKRWADYEACHVEDHISDTYGGDAGVSVGAKDNTARLARLLTPITSVHHAHTPELTILDAENAEGVWAMEDMLYWTQNGADHWLHGFGHYHEKYRKTAEGWKFCYRRLTRLRVNTSEGAALGDLNARSED